MQFDFHSSEGSSLGSEVELEIVDVDTRELHSGATEILTDAGRSYPEGAHPKAKHKRKKKPQRVFMNCEERLQLVRKRRTTDERLGKINEKTGRRLRRAAVRATICDLRGIWPRR